MGIIVSRDGKNAERVEPTAFRDEAHLQEYITVNPEALPLDEIDEDIRLLVLAREFSTNSGPIDALGVDQNGVIYIVETKLYKNADKRRVIAQVLDYGAALWRHGADFTEFTAQLETLAAAEFGMGVNEKVSDFFGISPEETAALLDNSRRCLNDGRFRFVILMDTMDDRLKDLITFVNQNSQFDVYGVELEYYNHDGYEILIPRLYGAEVRKTQASGVTTGTRRRWTEESFFDALRDKVSGSCVEAVRRAYDFGQSECVRVDFGTGAVSGSAIVRLTEGEGPTFTLSTEGWLWVDYGLWADAEKAILAAEAGLPNMDTTKNYQGFRPELWCPVVEQFIAAIRGLIEARKSEAGSADTV